MDQYAYVPRNNILKKEIYFENGNEMKSYMLNKINIRLDGLLKKKMFNSVG